MFGLTTLGTIHTAISLVAIACGFWALARDREIHWNRLGQAYLLTTLLTALTGLGIFRHGGFGPPHALSLMTLVALGIGALAARSTVFGGWSRVVQIVSFTTTFLFHAIPGFTESLVRLPVTKPYASSPEDPVLQPIYATLFVIYGIGLALQLRFVRRGATATA
jgi:uncharacterized membrane protein